MAHDLERPLITVSCHDDLTTADLVGRFLLEGGETRWVDGPLTRAVREGAICYLDEVVEARQDTTVVIHPLADHRRQLPIDRLGDRARRRAGVLPGRVVQPRLPERAQGPEGLDPPADGGDRAGLPAGRRRGEDRLPRGRRRPRAAPRSWCSSRRRSAGSRPPGSARWRRPACSIAAARLLADGIPLAAAARAAIAGPLTDDPVVGAGLREMIATYLVAMTAVTDYSGRRSTRSARRPRSTYRRRRAESTTQTSRRSARSLADRSPASPRRRVVGRRQRWPSGPARSPTGSRTRRSPARPVRSSRCSASTTGSCCTRSGPS